MATLIPTYDLAQEIGAEIEIDATTVGELLTIGRKRWGQPFEDVVRGAAIVVNGRAITRLKGKKTPLGPDDTVWLVNAAAGG